MSDRIVGVDPSLTSTGIAVITRTAPAGAGVMAVGTRIFLTTGLIKVPAEGKGALAESARVQEIVESVCRSAAGAERVAIESISYASRLGKPAERAHLFYSLVAACAARRWEVVTYTAAELKKLATGTGGGKSQESKQRVLDAVREAWDSAGWDDGAVGGRFDRSDAAALAWVSAAQSGWDVPKLPSTQTR